ncbi:MAG: IS4 family transposase, partial [Ectothiorhodospiraceae bacterium]
MSWIPVDTEVQAQRWEMLMDDEHFLGAGPLVGRRVRYLVVSSRYGAVAALSFSASAWRLHARDAYIGWGPEQREANLQRVVANSRFLIRSAFQLPGLASHVLAKTLRRLPRDWAARYGDEPVLVETFVDRARHRGGCYRAANWVYVGDTRGRGRNDSTYSRARTPKAVYVYPLRRGWRAQLGAARAPAAAALPVDDWARHEFAQARCGDERLRERVIAVTRAFAAHSEAATPEACGTRTRTKAAYRLLANPRVTMRELIGSHTQASAGRCRQHEVVLAVQDTTTLNYAAPSITEGLGPIGSRANGAQGLIVHDTMAFSTEGTPLGLIDVQAWAREADDHGLRRLAGDERDLDNKESGKWLDSHREASRLQAQLPASRVVSVADREGDIYELLVAAQHPEAADGLVRAQHDRRINTSGQPLSRHLQAQAPDAEVELNIPQRHNQPARIARLAVRY